MNNWYERPDPLFKLPTIGEFLKGISKVAKYAWSVITGEDKKQDEIAEQKGLNPEKSAANEIAELNKLLSEYRQNIVSAGESVEKEIIVECSMEAKEIMDVFDRFNKELKVARKESVKRKFKHLNTELNGTFSDYIYKKISLDNPDCIKILKLPAGELKKQRLQEMKQNVFIAAKDEMIKKIKYTVEEFSEEVEEAFEEHLDRAEESIETKKRSFEKMSAAAEGNSDEMENIILNSSYILSVCSFADAL